MNNNTIKTRLIGLLLLISLWPLAAAAADDETQRQEFRLALADARAGREPQRTDSEALRRYVLYPYLEAARIQALMARGAPGIADAAVPVFVTANPELPVTRELRRQWLMDLARRDEWKLFLAHYFADVSDRALQCQRFNARIASGSDAGLPAELLAFWTAAPQMPSDCQRPFDWLQQRGEITADATEQRARKALADGNAGFARTLIAQLPAERAPPLRQWQQLLEDPEKALGALAAGPAQQVEAPALKAAFEKLARKDPRAADRVLQQFAPSRLPDGVRGEAANAIALGLSWNRDPLAVERFGTVPMEALDERSYEWRVRAALWNRQWTQAAQWLSTMPPALAAEPRWIYWRARVAEELGQREQAKALFRQLTQDNGYYAVMSAWRLDQHYEPRHRKLDEKREVQKQLMEQPAMRRARELFHVDELNWANAEWRSAIKDLDAAQREQAALLASRWGWHWQAVLLLNQLDATDALAVLYPDAYARDIKRSAKDVDLPSTWVYGVMRQESLFLRQVASSSDALGLLQIKLDTARDVARRTDAPRPDREDLFDPATNLKLGTAYLRQMTDRFGGQFVLTLSAYNAGPNAVARWLPEAPLDADVWIENVPYNETRGYVQRIVWHITVHAWQQGSEAHDLGALLKPVSRPGA